MFGKFKNSRYRRWLFWSDDERYNYLSSSLLFTTISSIKSLQRRKIVGREHYVTNENITNDYGIGITQLKAKTLKAYKLFKTGFLFLNTVRKRPQHCCKVEKGLNFGFEVLIGGALEVLTVT
jgi:hypothetical protein